MKTIDTRLEESAAEVRRGLGELPSRHPSTVRRSLNLQRGMFAFGGTAAMVLLAGGALLLTARQVPNDVAQANGSAGGMTFEEYETAYTNYVECLRDADFQINGPLRFGRDHEAPFVFSIGADPTIQLTYMAQVDPTEEARYDRVDAECRDTHVETVEQHWFEQEAERSIDSRLWLDNLLACAEANSMTVPAEPDYDEILNDIGGEPADREISNLGAEAITKYGCRPWNQ